MHYSTTAPEKFVSVLFIFFSFWWAWLTFFIPEDTAQHLLFGSLYGTTITLVGTCFGFTLAKHWGGWRSLLGKAMIALSSGLLAQFFGQFIFSYYNIILDVALPYPSLADIGYFGSIPFYMYGMYILGKASGIKAKNVLTIEYFPTLLIPISLLFASYLFFLRSYDFGTTSFLTFFLDFGYPFGQALYVSLALYVYTISRSTLGGVFRRNILLFIFAFVGQYVADFNFLYQNLHGTWINGGYGDYLYLVAYMLMTNAFIQCSIAYHRVRNDA